MKKMTLSEELAWRGFVNQTTFENIQQLDERKLKFYWGVDPSASSMTIGNLAAAMMVRIFIKHGHIPYLLVGGATGLIGDPDGKAQERDLKTEEEISENKKSIVSQYERIFDGLNFEVVDNYDWFKDFGYLDFLRTIGKHVPMRQMLSRDFVQSRLGEGGAGISYAEFSYSLIQGYDYLHLFEKHGVELQISGADQWGNCIAGVDLIRRKTGKEAHIWTTPLVINKTTGKKFGKSEDGAVWLDPNLTSVFKFYQFWLNVDDEGVNDYLKIFTPLDKQQIDTVMEEFEASPGGRAAQKCLAYEVTKLVHGKSEAESVVRTTDTLFGNDYTMLTTDDIEKIVNDFPRVKVHVIDNRLDQERLREALTEVGLSQSKTEARRFIEQGAISINGVKVTGEMALFPLLEANKYAIARRGKNNFAIFDISN